MISELVIMQEKVRKMLRDRKRTNMRLIRPRRVDVGRDQLRTVAM